nr:antitoxin Xre/MbcA/ParS toxin-binding domain-containing protein [Pseudomonas violetae]
MTSVKEYQPEESISGSIWTALGLPSRGATLFDLVRTGLPFEFLDQIANLLQIKREVIAKAIWVSPQTLARRAKAGRFSTIESDRLVSLIAVFQVALALFESDVGAAKDWMTSPVRGLGSKRPLEMLGTRAETEAVLDHIGRLERGVLA